MPGNSHLRMGNSHFRPLSSFADTVRTFSRQFGDYLTTTLQTFDLYKNFGGCCRDRTYDKLIKSQLLYQLS